MWNFTLTDTNRTLFLSPWAYSLSSFCFLFSWNSFKFLNFWWHTISVSSTVTVLFFRHFHGVLGGRRKRFKWSIYFNWRTGWFVSLLIVSHIWDTVKMWTAYFWMYKWGNPQFKLLPRCFIISFKIAFLKDLYFQ